MPPRFFPGPQGTGANVVVPMTDFSLPNVDGNRLTEDALKEIILRTGTAKQRLNNSGLAKGNKVASEMRILREEVSKTDIPIELYGGPTLRDDMRYTFRLPQTPATLLAVPQTIDELLEIYGDKLMGGNISNVFRNQVQLAAGGLGPETCHVFSPSDRYLEEWLEGKLTNGAEQRFVRHELEGIDARIGFATPFDNGSGGLQQFSFNKPQGSTIDPMRDMITKLEGIDHVVVSEGIGILLAQHKLQIAQIFNPTSALHTESALEANQRKNEKGMWQDITIVNDDEAEHWIKIMEEREFGTKFKDIADAKFPMPFLKSDPKKIDEASVNILRASHRRFLTLGDTRETDAVSFVAGIGCGPKGGQNLFQSRGRHFVAAASTLTDKGAERLIDLCGLPNERGVNMNTRDVVGAGDAAFTASLMHRFYSPLEDIIETRHPNLSDDRKRIATMAFTTILQRVFGELVYHSKTRDLSEVPPQAFGPIFDKTLDKAIDAALKLTTIDKVPTNVFQDPEWETSFMLMELDGR